VVLGALGDQAATRDGDYWLLASLGEASLVLGQTAQALDCIARAVQLAGGRLGEIASMRRTYYCSLTGIAFPDDLLRWSGGSVVASPVIWRITLSGWPMAYRSVFPRPQSWRRLWRAIGTELQRLNVVSGLSSAACGSDIIFLACSRGAELHIVLPSILTDFYCTSVDFGLDRMSSWRDRCDRVLASATEVHYATQEHSSATSPCSSFANTLMAGLTVLRARELRPNPTPWW